MSCPKEKEGEKMRTILALLLMTLVIGTVVGCQNSSKDQNMSAAEHAKM